MFNFTTTTVINKLTYGKKKEDLLKIWDSSKASSASASDGVGTTTVGTSDTTKVNGFSVNRVRDFYKDKAGEKVLSIYKALGYDETLGTVTIDLTKVWTSAAADATSTTAGTTGQYRLALYVRLHGSENPYYANDLVFKGKPFYVEFMVKAGDTATTIAEKVASIAKKYIAMIYEDELLEVTAASGKVTINATDAHQRFTKVELQKFESGIFAMEGTFEPIQSISKMTYVDPSTGSASSKTYYYDLDGTELTSQSTSNNAITVANGIEGFGDYVHLMKDYRLPTAANTRWIKIQGDESPILGALYNQYTITYCSDRGTMGQSVVGEPTKSITTHVFWVNQDVATAFEAGLTALGWANGNAGDTNNNGIIDTVPTAETKA